MIDLSRGDPAMVLHREFEVENFFSFLLFLDTKLNNNGRRFVETKKSVRGRF